MRTGCRIRMLRSLAAATLLMTPIASAQRSPSKSLDEIEVSAGRFGVGDAVRPGEWAGVELMLRDLGNRARQVVVRLELTDVDGDTARHERLITLNPGRRQGVWLYPHLPFHFDRGSVLSVTVHAVVGDEGSDAVGARLGAKRIGPSRVLRAEDGLIGVVGRRTVGLEQYAIAPPGSDFSATAHELTQVVADLTPDAMPDAWMGLAVFDALVWVEGDPGRLTEDAAEAIRQWVRRGGHLVVCLPAAGQTWSNARGNPLLDLMPAATLTRREGVDLNPYRWMLTSSPRIPLPSAATLHTFQEAEGAGRDEARPILRGPDRDCVVMRRLVGDGAVTLVGFDLTDRKLIGKISAQQLWNRILGRRADILTLTEINELSQKGEVDFTSRDPIWLDDSVGALINMTGRAGAGVLLGLVVFITYLLLAGPVGFALLKRRHLERHSWVAFVAVAGVFTIIAWGGATSLKPTTVRVKHLTFLDVVSGQKTVRTRTWFSALLPTYGSQTVSLVDPAEEALPDRQRQALTSWDNPVTIAQRSFPDSRAYVVRTRRPDSLRVPSRSTVKQFQADWIGPPSWRMPSPGKSGIGFNPDGSLRGVLTHKLPASLENVQIVLIKQQRPLTKPHRGGPLIAESYAWAWRSWAPGSPLDLSTLSRASRTVSGESFLEDLAGIKTTSGDAFGDDGRSRDLRYAPKRLAALAWAPMLEPPNWRSIRGVKTLLRRRSTHGWDLGRWFTEPCLIIVGQLADAESPTPVYVDGVRAPTHGRTVLRWIYPLMPQAPEVD